MRERVRAKDGGGGGKREIEEIQDIYIPKS